jgi:hypothetical protein
MDNKEVTEELPHHKAPSQLKILLVIVRASAMLLALKNIHAKTTMLKTNGILIS